MKKIVMFFLLVAVFLSFNVYASEFKILDMRDQIFQQSQQVRALIIPKTKDGVVLTAVFDSCMLTVSQLDAYFSMLGIFESANKANAGKAAIKFIVAWLNGVKSTNTQNIQNLGDFKHVEPKTQAQIKQLKDSFIVLSGLLDTELNKLAIVQSQAKK